MKLLSFSIDRDLFIFFFFIDDYVKSICHCVMIPTQIFCTYISFFSLYGNVMRVSCIVYTQRMNFFVFTKKKNDNQEKKLLFRSVKKIRTRTFKLVMQFQKKKNNWHEKV